MTKRKMKPIAEPHKKLARKMLLQSHEDITRLRLSVDRIVAARDEARQSLDALRLALSEFNRQFGDCAPTLRWVSGSDDAIVPLVVVADALGYESGHLASTLRRILGDPVADFLEGRGGACPFCAKAPKR